MTAVAIPLVKSDRTAFVSPEDVELVSDHRWRLLSSSKSHHCYALAYVGGGRNIYMHRMILGAASDGRGMYVDHIDGNGLNNTRENIRLVTPSQNISRAVIPKRKHTGLRGVHKQGNRWVAQISKDGKKVYLGIFQTEIEAGIAYDAACKMLFGEFAPRPNVP